MQQSARKLLLENWTLADAEVDMLSLLDPSLLTFSVPPDPLVQIRLWDYKFKYFFLTGFVCFTGHFP